MSYWVLLTLGAVGGLVAGFVLTAALGSGRRLAREKTAAERREEKLAEELSTLLAEREQTREVLVAMGDGVVVLNDDGNILQANPAASHLLATDLQGKLGTPLVHAARTFPVRPLLDKAKDQGSLVGEVDLPGGRHLHVQAIPLGARVPLGAEGEPSRFLLMLRDDTARHRTDSMRRDFVTNVSHELKTPLARLSLLASTLRHAVEENPEEARRFSDRLAQEVERLSALVNDLLTLSRLEERAATSPDFQVIDLAVPAQEAAAGLASAYEEAGTHLEIRTEPTLVRGDLVHLETMARNLLDNARRYTDREGHVGLEVKPEGAWAVLRVRDDGLGIPRDAQARVFERFYRVDRARSRETGGTGLGLSIVRHVVEQHGGRIELESAVGVGSIFTVRLPLAGGNQAADPQS